MGLLNKVWVFAEQQDVLAQLCKGGRQLGREVSAIVLGNKEEVEKASHFGADIVYWLGVPGAETMLEDYVDTLLSLLNRETPDLLMVQPSRRGKLIAGRLAANLKTSVLVDATEILATDGKVQATHMVYGGAAFRVEKASGKTVIATVGAGVFDGIPDDETTRQSSVVEVEYVEPTAKIKLLEKKQKKSTEVNLNAAKVVVGVGRGIADKEDLKMVGELADLLEAEIGCTRPIAEGVNWLPRERYIGVSGAMLKPDVYFALGISGQVQHMVGVNQARVIIAINKDKAAPIFGQSDYGVVGDLYKVIPPLIEKFKATR